LKAGDPADDADTWLRAVTNSTHIRRGGVHHAEFKKWLSPPDDPQAGWKLEISGQLLSLVGNIADRAQKRVDEQKDKLKAKGKDVPSALQFCGVLHAKVAKVRSLLQLSCDVIYDPQPSDDAHANIVILDKGADEIMTVIDALLDCVAWVPKDQIGANQALSSNH
jgi:hypothetical protein